MSAQDLMLGLRQGPVSWIFSGWMDKWTAGWIGGWMNRWIDGWIDGRDAWIWQGPNFWLSKMVETLPRLPFDFSVPSTPFPQDRVGPRGHKWHSGAIYLAVCSVWVNIWVRFTAKDTLPSPEILSYPVSGKWVTTSWRDGIKGKC